MRIVERLHDLALAILVGSVAGVGLSAITLFDRAPSREFAGQIGNAIFEMFGLMVLVLSLVVLASRFAIHRNEAPSAARLAALAISVMIVLMAAVIALWLTPVMGRIWATAAHAPDGSGLVGDERSRFMMLHGIGNLGYVSIMLMGALLVVMRRPFGRV